MLAPEKTARPLEREANIARLVAAFEVLTQVLTQAGVSSSDLLGCLYLAAEDDLLTILRLAAALSPQQRAQAADMLWAMLWAMLEAGEPTQS
jgi:DNA-binding phage protein